MYHLYIASNATREINLSYACRGCVVLWFESDWNALPLDQKHTVFDDCVIEIELLMQTSVIYSFHASEEFKEIAKKESQRNGHHSNSTKPISSSSSAKSSEMSCSPNS